MTENFKLHNVSGGDLRNLMFSQCHVTDNYSFHLKGNSWINFFLTLSHITWIVCNTYDCGPKGLRRLRKLDRGLFRISCGVEITRKYVI
jgi:hypothetical protein